MLNNCITDTSFIFFKIKNDIHLLVIGSLNVFWPWITAQLMEDVYV